MIMLLDRSYVLALHIIFVVTWFSGLFYIVRLFIYHREAQDKEETEKNILQQQFKVMEKRLWYGIAWPSMILTLLFGGWLISFNVSGYLSSPWFTLKLLFVAGLILYHVRCHVMYKHMQQDDVMRYSSFKLRIWNEVATLFLVSIVFIVVLKDTLSFVWGLIGIAILTATLYLAIRIYRKGREQKKESAGQP